MASSSRISIIGGGPAGLYFAALSKKTWPASQVDVYDHAESGGGCGLGLDQHTLETLAPHDSKVFEQLRATAFCTQTVEVRRNGRTVRSLGEPFCGWSRTALLDILRERAHELGARVCNRNIEDIEVLADSDLIVVADGSRSSIRSRYAHHFQPSTDVRPNKFLWLSSTARLDAYSYFFFDTQHGTIAARAYPYDSRYSNWIVEVPESVWRASGLHEMSAAGTLAALEGMLESALEGQRLIGDGSGWRSLEALSTKTWVLGKAVLVGGAKATIHYAHSSGFAQAIGDAVALRDALVKSDTIETALALYDSARHEDIGRIRHAADFALAPFEHAARYRTLSDEQFAFGVLSRSGKLGWDDLERRDPQFIAKVRASFARKAREQGMEVDTIDPPMPMFTPLRLRELVLENRVVVSPMDQYAAVDGMPNDWHLVHLGSRAVGGAGLLCVEMTCPSPEARISPGCTGLWNEAQRDAFAHIVSFCHAHSRAKICLQLGHAGRKGSTQLAWQRIDHPLPESNWPLIAPSPLPYLDGVSQVPREMDRGDMDKVVADFVRATRYADQAGFDMLELHMAHGYLLASFISPLTNRRRDEYGGPIENRMRFPLEVFRACRAAWPRARPMSVRISATDWVPGGLSTADLIALARMLKDAGCDVIDCSAGQTVAKQKTPYGPAYQSPYADLVRNEVGIATITVGAVTTPDEVNALLAAGKADLVALARPHLTNPYFTLHAALKYQYAPQYWPPEYFFGRAQVMRSPEASRPTKSAAFCAPRGSQPNTHESGGSR
ncbi:MAG: bifunctional salicylyl-CoA 5-hydroxylase/oxidoreductase [Burkholderiales bacterium]|nr:bifunctional salicylyl-CoA 5-hydroxylase/oxidoreductase [Burkholderiales bacterium]